MSRSRRPGNDVRALDEEYKLGRFGEVMQNEAYLFVSFEVFSARSASIHMIIEASHSCVLIGQRTWMIMVTTRMNKNAIR